MLKLIDANTHSTRVSDIYFNGSDASGGTACHGIYYSASGGSTGGEPIEASPDAYNCISQVYLQAFNGGNRDCINIHSTDSRNRGCRMSDIFARNGGRHGICVDGAPDGDLTGFHLGGFDSDGVNINAGNWRISHGKSFYCEGYGFNIGANRITGSVLEAQDCVRGFNLSGTQQDWGQLKSDTCQSDGIVINNAGIQIHGCDVFVRGGGRYATQTNGIRFVGSPNGVIVQGQITPANITNKISGTYSGVRNRISIDDGTTMITVN
jgi:hypothetical protein